MQIYAFEIENLDPKELNIAFTKNHKYMPAKFSDAGRHIMEVVHGIPMLFEDFHLGEVEIYLGRSFFDPSRPREGVYQRLKSSREKRQHEYAAIALSCGTDIVPLWEKAAIKTIAKLKEKRRLCVCDIVNEKLELAGSYPKSKESAIYLTWKAGKKKTRIQHLTPQQISSASKEISEELYGEITWPQIRNVLSVTTDVEQYVDIEWGHDIEATGCDEEISPHEGWDYEGIGRLTVRAAKDDNMATSISGITGISARKVAAILEKSPGNMRVKNVFLSNWPEESWIIKPKNIGKNEIEYIGDLTIAYCRNNGMEKEIARIANVSQAKVKNILSNLNGRGKIKYAIDEWPWPE